jgi:hypothetical protein
VQSGNAGQANELTESPDSELMIQTNTIVNTQDEAAKQSGNRLETASLPTNS